MQPQHNMLTRHLMSHNLMLKRGNAPTATVSVRHSLVTHA
jgi:hypothetical protein